MDPVELRFLNTNSKTPHYYDRVIAGLHHITFDIETAPLKTLQMEYLYFCLATGKDLAKAREDVLAKRFKLDRDYFVLLYGEEHVAANLDYLTDY